jgi:hypothetical protein
LGAWIREYSRIQFPTPYGDFAEAKVRPAE